jgi:hypothetical protein
MLTPGATGLKRVGDLSDADIWWDGDDETWRPAIDAREWYDDWLWVEVIGDVTPAMCS